MTTRAEPAALATDVIGHQLLRRAAGVLAAEGIAVMPLKGLLLQALVYREPAARVYADVDVLVPASSWDRALGVLEGAGLRCRRYGRGKALARAADLPLTLDVHGQLFPPHMFTLPTHELFARARPDTRTFGVAVWLPDPLDMYAHAVGHFAKGRLGASARIQLEDLARIAAAYDLCARACARHLAGSGLARAARYVLPLAHAACGDPFAPRVLEALPPDPLGTALARLGGRLLAHPASRTVRLLAPEHLLNTSLPRAALSATAHASERVKYVAAALRPGERSPAQGALRASEG